MMMGVGLGILLLSLLIHTLAVTRTNKLCKASRPSNYRISLRFIYALFVVTLRGCSFLSNSYICSCTTSAKFRSQVELLLSFVLRFSIEVWLSKQELSSVLMSIFPLRMLGLADGHHLWIFIPEILPVLSLIMLAYILYKSSATVCCWRFLKYSVVAGTILSYVLVAMHWAIESKILAILLVHEIVGRNLVPRIIYTIGFGLLILLTFVQLFEKKTLTYRESMVIKTLALLSIWSPTVIILLGRQGPLVALASVIGAYCIIRVVNLEPKVKDVSVEVLTYDPLPVSQWSLLAVCLFFYTGRWYF